MDEILDVSKHYKKCHPSQHVVHVVSDKNTPLQGWCDVVRGTGLISWPQKFLDADMRRVWSIWKQSARI
ncbi:hypothetical protein Y032_0003g1562 [Ancylostoma ceylanicum]|uniref:Uncharacterized protein n=1 Tax=Ancylostoma ceylanicum TaxID=53326 RepID=A0A016VYL9_9BILA|nr:hypothetical protein Y032_0003g1562 [Ancylostoma ceylanicum]